MAYEDDDYEAPVDDSADDSAPPPSSPAQDDDWEPYVPQQASASASQDDDWEPYNPKPKESEGLVGTAARELASDVGPAAAGFVTGSAAAAPAGAAAGAALGPIGGAVGGFAGMLGGGFAGAYAAEKAQDYIKDKMGLDDTEQRLANEREHPWLVAGIRGASNLVGFTRGAATAAQRIAGAVLGGGVAAGQELANRGTDLFTAQGLKEAAPNILAQGAAGALLTKPRGYVESAQQAGERWAQGIRPNTPAPPPAPEPPAQGGFDLQGGATREGKQLDLPLEQPKGPQPVQQQGELPMRTPIQEQGQLDLPSPDEAAGGRRNTLEARGDIASPVEPRMPAPGEGEGQGELFPGEQQHGTPGPTAAAGTAEEQAPPAKPAENQPGHGPEDYGKKPKTPAEPGGGVHVGEGPDPTLEAAIKKPQPKPEEPKNELPPDVPAPPEPKPPAPPPAAENPRVEGNYHIEKQPDGKWHLKDRNTGEVISQHDNMGEAYKALLKTKQQAAAAAQPVGPAPEPPPRQKVGRARPRKTPPVNPDAPPLPPEAPPPRGTKEVEMIGGQKVKVTGETTLKEALEKHGTREGLMAPVTHFAKTLVNRSIGNMPVYVIPHSELARFGHDDAIAFYHRGQNYIGVNDAHINNPEKMAHAILHEAIHGITVHAIVRSPVLQQTMRNVMRDIFERERAVRLGAGDKTLKPGTSYGFFGNERRQFDPTEFVTEAFSNPDFQKMLAGHELSPGVAAQLNAMQGALSSRNPIKTAWDAVVGVVRKLLGVPPEKTNALEAAMRATQIAAEKNEAAKAKYFQENGKQYEPGQHEVHALKEGEKPPEPPEVKATPEDLKADIWTGIKRFVGATASETPSGKAARNNIMEKEGRATWMKNFTESKFTDAMHRMLNDKGMTEDRARRLVNYIQGGNDFPGFKPTPQEMEVVGALREVHKKFEDALRAMPEFERMQFIDNDKYLAGQYKNTKEAQQFYREFARAGGSGSTKKRFYATDEDARRAGLTPISTNPIERVVRYANSMADYMSFRQQISDGVAKGYIKYYSPETVAAAGTPNPYQRGGPPEGWSPIKGLTDRNGKQAYAPTDYASVFNNFHGAGLGRTPETRNLVDFVRRANNTFTSFELGIATYHAFTTAHERIASGMSTALSQAVRGDMVGAGRTFANALASPGKEMFGSTSYGKHLQDVYLGKKTGTPQEQAIVEAMKDANFKPINAKHTLDYDMSKAGSLYTSIVRGSLKHEMAAAYKEIVGDKNWKEGMLFVPRMAARMMQTIAHPLFQAYIPRMKVSAFAENVKAWMDANPNHTREDLREAAIKIGKSIDNRMGEMAHDNMMMNRVLRDSASLALRSFSFTIGGVFREIGGGAQSLARGAMKGENRLSMSSKNYDPRSAYAVAFPIAVASMSMIYQYMKTGKGPDEWRDLIWPETGGKQPGVGKGRMVPERALLPGYHKDIAAYIAHPTREAGNKLSGLWQAIGDQISGTKMTETGPKPIVPPKASLGEAALERAKAFGEHATPIFARTAMKTPGKQSNISYPEQLLGFRSPGKWAADPVGQKIADDKRAQREWRASEQRENRDRASRGLPPLPARRYQGANQ